MDVPEHILITYNWGQNADSIIGKVQLTPEGLNPTADLMWKLWAKNPEMYSLEIGYTNGIVDENGVITGATLTEISMITKSSKKGSVEPSMALDSLIDDLAD